MLSTPVNISEYQIIEELYNGSRTLVYRGYRETDSLPVVIKLLKNPYPSFGELVQFRNQYTIAKNLNSPLIIQTYSLKAYQNGYILVMEDFGGISLKEYFTSSQKQYNPSLQEFLKIAISLCDALDFLSRYRIIHKDIKPSNILINPDTKQVKLIDFSIASLLPRETQEIKNPNVLEGTLAYISPEQTGRMNRGIDYRSDFYCLGVTFYELLTGTLPFSSSDPMELVHSHIAKQPTFLEDRGKDIPQVLVDIVMKLMAKNAENRYQNILGLKFDLENCCYQLQETGNIQYFEIAKRDICDRFIIPEKLYGREWEIEQLLKAFNRVAGVELGNNQISSSSELILVTGFSGIGKTAVINEVNKPIVKKFGYFIKGKFDQFNRNIPFSAFVQALQDLIGQLLTQSDTKLIQWKDKIISVLGENAQVIIEVIPELEKIIGSQPAVTELSGTAAQNRFNLLFQKFIQIFATQEHPLVIFIDDLQWADASSLSLIHLLMSEINSGYLLLIGAYRDNEVFSAHPLMLTLDEVQKSGKNINTINLQPLDQINLNNLIADTLRCSFDLAKPLGKLVYQKTQGNPFFATQFLQCLHRDSLIYFNFEAAYWQCDLIKIQEAALTDDVVEFMALQLQKMPSETLEIVKLASCIGNQFNLKTLAIISQELETETATKLWKSLQEGLILPTSEVYKFYVEQESDDLQLQFHDSKLNYKFIHDRVQQAAYSLIPQEKKQSTHLLIGQLLLKFTSEKERENYIFEIVGQMNLGRELIQDNAEKKQLAQMNLLASQKARNSTAYSATSEYAKTGIELLSSRGWQEEYDLMLALNHLSVESAFLVGQFVEVVPGVQIILKEAKTLLDKIKAYEVLIQTYVAQKEFWQSLEIGLTVLRQLGVKLPTKPQDQDVIFQFLQTLICLRKRQPQWFLDLPELTDYSQMAALRIMNLLIFPAFFVEQRFIALLACWCVRLSVKSGRSPLAGVLFAAYGMVLCTANNLAMGYEFGEVARKLSAEGIGREIHGKTIYFYANLTLPWKRPLQEAVRMNQIAAQIALEVGDLRYVVSSYFSEVLSAFYAGIPLEDLIHKLTIYQPVITKFKEEAIIQLTSLLKELVLGLVVLPLKNSYLIQDEGLEAEWINQWKIGNNLTSLCAIYGYKAHFSYWFGDYQRALINHNLSLPCWKGLGSDLSIMFVVFMDSLIRLAAYPSCDTKTQKQLLKQVNSNQRRMAIWVKHSPENIQHKYNLVKAEYLALLGERQQANDFYDRAIAGAKENNFLQEEALANELAAKFYLQCGKEKIAQVYMQEAYYCYARWGAKAKVEDLQQHYPQLLKPILNNQQQNFNSLESIENLLDQTNCQLTQFDTKNHNRISDYLDFKSILKAAQSISSSIEIDELLGSLSQIILVNTGAKKSALILPNHHEWQLRVITYVIDGKDSLTTTFQQESLDKCQEIPIQLIQYVKNTKETVVIDNCQTQISGVISAYMLQHQPKSVLCMPILNQNNLVGILYLENHLTQGVFTNDRISILNILCSQAAISLANSQLFSNLQLSENRYKSLASNVPGVIYQFQLSIDGKISFPYISPGCWDMFELTQQEIISDSQRLLSLIHPEDLIDFFKIVEESARNLTPKYWQGRCILNSGKIVWIQSASRPECTKDGHILWDGLLMDISKRKIAELLAIEKSQELEQALQNLQQAQLQIVQSEKMSALGNLVAGVAHEMNNPLGFIGASLEQTKPTIDDIFEHLKLYQESLPNPSKAIIKHSEKIDLDYNLEDLPKILDAMLMACDRLQNISTSLRTFSRADQDYKVPFNIHEGINSTILILKHRLKGNEERPAIEVITEYENLPKIECFPGQLNQVFMNILANAIDALEESNIGHSFTEIKKKNNRIIVKTSVENNQVKITIGDNGKGISEEVKQHIFDHLFTTKSVGKGTGLGLAIARQIVEETHNGKLSYHSMVGEGTEFSIFLPLTH
ncbi:ATP-binding sensor histidine kinase [Calothrix sp. PCC 6303]|uniref:ATP-binding sensor histidine kinase n=1 Tax=Calothrix sp. PCC 6303 TaxID=1170562 RepID=UPI0002A05882|nr:ATP-binding sensor histidine kinase [Calothrix sp. PCC 6303]AFZ03707.1 multi-sensor signal transduction multi-kinase [Calothrix sp. PCC 6303]